jgi:hypothetical protein
MTPAVSELADRAEISGLVSRYLSAIDDKRLDPATMEAVFTATGRRGTPGPRGAHRPGQAPHRTVTAQYLANRKRLRRHARDREVNLMGTPAGAPEDPVRGAA